MASFSWRCPACTHHHQDEIVGWDGPFLTLICTNCAKAVENHALQPSEAKSWDYAIKEVDAVLAAGLAGPRLKYETAIEKRVAAGFVPKKEAAAWIRQIAKKTSSVKTEADDWGITIEDVSEICCRIFQKYKLVE